VARQLQDRFHDDKIGIFEEMEHFTPRKLTAEDDVPACSIANLCNSMTSIQKLLQVSLLSLNMPIVLFKA